MKTLKMSFKNIKDVLSRDEMRGIMAGSNPGTCSVRCCSTCEAKTITDCDRATVETSCGNVSGATCNCY